MNTINTFLEEIGIKYFINSFDDIHFEGRARRREYWWTYFWTICILVYFGFFFISDLNSSDIYVRLWGYLQYTIICAAFFIPLLAVSIRRLHDVGLSGWWWLVTIIPVIGGIFFLIIALLRGQQKSNAWGCIPLIKSEGKKEKQFRWSYKKAVIGEKDAQYFIGWCYFRGEGVKHNASEAKYWLEKASNQGDYRASGILSTLKYKESSDWDVILLTRAAEQGDPHSCFQIATESWISPKGEEKFNSFSGIKPEAAYNFIKKAADKHFSPSYEILGLFYLEGYGITQDTTKAIDIMETGAMGGCKVCSRLLGFIYDLETYGCRNLEKSAEWYELGATQGDNESQAIFAQKLKNGDGCIKNIKESYKWLLICKKNIHTFKVDTQKEILDSINELETILSSASIEDIQKTASEITNEKENSEEFEYLIPTPPIEPKFSQYHFLVFAIISLILPVIINIFKV